MESEEERCRQLYEQIAWPLGKIYGHPYDAFKLALTYVIAFWYIYPCVMSPLQRARRCIFAA